MISGVLCFLDKGYAEAEVSKLLSLIAHCAMAGASRGGSSSALQSLRSPRQRMMMMSSDEDSDLPKPRAALNIGHLSGLGASAEGGHCPDIREELSCDRI